MARIIGEYEEEHYCEALACHDLRNALIKLLENNKLDGVNPITQNDFLSQLRGG